MFERIVKKLRELHKLTVEGKGKTKEAKELCKAIDGAYAKLSKANKSKVMDLYTQSFDPKWTGIPGPKSLARARVA